MLLILPIRLLLVPVLLLVFVLRLLPVRLPALLRLLLMPAGLLPVDGMCQQAK